MNEQSMLESNLELKKELEKKELEIMRLEKLIDKLRINEIIIICCLFILVFYFLSKN
jgi:uncharacterized membrane protein (DUF106 family)